MEMTRRKLAGAAMAAGAQETVRPVPAEEIPVKKVAVGGGSCGSMLADALAAGCDTFVTADVKYDQYLEAKALGITLMDAGHYATENVVCAPLVQRLAEQFPDTTGLLSACHKEVYGSV